MKRPDPTEAQTYAVDSPDLAAANVTVGHTVDPARAQDWARQLGLEQPLALILNALRSAEYLGTALNYLTQEVTRDQLQRWALEVDFVDDLLALGDAYATSEGIRKAYPPLPMDTPILRQMKDGAVARHPLAAVLVRRISTTNPANDAWLETFRAWWVLQFLQAEARGDKLGRRRTRIGLAIRMCIQETTGRGLWTPVLMELQGADESNRKLHEHLIDYARRTYKQPGCEGSRRDLLRALAYVDAPDDEDREVLSRDAGIPNGAQADSSPYPAWGTISAFSPARPLSAHWLEDLDGFLTDQDDETAVANTSPPVVDIESVAVDENRSDSQQRKLATSLQLLSIEEQQRLPYSWSKPNPQERELLKQWWKALWRKPDHPDHDLAVLTYLAAQTCVSVRLVLRLEISGESTDDWRWDPQAQYLHRLRPRRDRSAQPGNAALPHIKPLAERIVLQTPAAVTAFLSQRTQDRPNAANLEGMFGPEKQVEKRAREALAVVAPRITPAMFGGWVAQLVFEETDDPVLTYLLSSNSRSALPGACAYAAYDQSAASKIVQLGVGARLTAQHPGVTGSLNSVGSSLHVKDEWVKHQLQELLARVNSLSGDPSKWLEHHNAIATYIVVVLLCTSGARPVNSPFQAPSDFDLERGTVYIEDKVSSLMHAGRLIPIDLTVANLIRTRYLEHLKALASIVKMLEPDTAIEIELLSRKRDSSQIPFFFYLLQDENGLRVMEIGEKTLATLGGFTLEMQINVLRHRQSTWLKGKGADHEVINGILGHAESGTAVWGPSSARTWKADTDEVRGLLAESVKALGISKPKLLSGRPSLNHPSPAAHAALARQRKADKRYGREARAARTLRANAVAREQAQQDIDQYLKDRKKEGENLVHLDKNDIEQLEHLMLSRRTDPSNPRRGDDIRHPRAALRYEVFSDWMQHVRDLYGFVIPIKRRYLPRLEEPSPFTAESAGACEVFRQVSEWHTTWLENLNPSCLDLREGLATAILGVVVESRVANMDVVRSLLMNQDIRVVRLDGYWYLEHAKFLDKYPQAPVTRYALSGTTAAQLLRIATSEDRAKLQTRKVKGGGKKLAGILGLTAESPTYEDLFKRLCAVVQQVNWQELPGLSAGYLDGSMMSVGLDHHSWHRLHRKQALLVTTYLDADDAISKLESREDSDDRFMELDESESAPTITASPESPSRTAFTPVVRDARFAPAESPATTESMASSEVSNCKKSDRKATAAMAIAIALERTAIKDIPEQVAKQIAARALMKATYAILASTDRPKTNVQRHLDAKLRMVIAEHPAASVSCRMFVDWIRSLITTPTRGRPLEISSISRYFVALSACFEQMAYEHDLTKCEEEEVTELYANIMQARRLLKADMKESRTSKSKPSSSPESADENRERYQTWTLALRLLRKFHRFALRHYEIEDADWSEVGSQEETLSISPRIVLEREYLNALSVLVGNAEDASLGETQASMLLLLTYRFGLRGAEATNLTTADLVDSPEEALHGGAIRSLLVLVRNNHFRRLKTDNARRQVPLLFSLTELERRLIERHRNLLDTAIGRDTDTALFPDLAGKANLGANMRMRAYVAHQLKASCSDPTVSLHTARHAFANLIASMLLDGTEALRDRMFETVPSTEWVKHVRKTVLCHANTTRRSTWALARLMGHSHPRMALRSYVHIIPELTYARIPLHRDEQGIAETQTSLARRVVNLDALASTADYLSPPVTRPAKPDHLKPTSAKALLALSLIANGTSVPLVARKCDLTLEHAQDLAWLEDEAIKAYGTLKRSKSKKDGLRPLLTHVRERQLQRFRDRASSGAFDDVPWDSSLLTPNLLPATLIGPSRQIVLFREEHFKFLASLMNQWGIDREQMRFFRSSELPSPMLQWATNASFPLVEAPVPLRRKSSSSKDERALPARLKPRYQVDTLKSGISRVLVPHRCVALPAESAGALEMSTYELIALVVVHLFMLRANHPELAREATAEAAARLDIHQLVV